MGMDNIAAAVLAIRVERENIEDRIGGLSVEMEGLRARSEQLAEALAALEVLDAPPGEMAARPEPVKPSRVRASKKAAGPGGVRCPECGGNFAAQGLAIHRSKMHGVGGEKAGSRVACSVCGKKVRRDYLGRHKATHDGGEKPLAPVTPIRGNESNVAPPPPGQPIQPDFSRPKTQTHRPSPQAKAAADHAFAQATGRQPMAAEHITPALQDRAFAVTTGEA